LAFRRQFRTVVELWCGVDHPTVSPGHLEADGPDRRGHLHDLALQAFALALGVPQADRRRLAEHPVCQRRPPFCRMITPVFHPNIDATKICIGDHWSAGQRLAHLIVRIGEMITYQSYNTKSPLNGEAAAWAEQNQPRLPLENVDLAGSLG
jgi:hypothetical protein